MKTEKEKILEQMKKKMLGMVKEIIKDSITDSDFDINVCELVYADVGEKLIPDEFVDDEELDRKMLQYYEVAADQCYNAMTKALAKVGRKKSTRYIVKDNYVIDTKSVTGEEIANCDSHKTAKKIARKLNN